MKRTLAFLGTIALTVSLVLPAWSAEINGKIKSVESWSSNGRSVTFEDGTKIFVPHSHPAFDKVKAGAVVKGSYYEKNGEKIAGPWEVRPGGCPEGPPCPQ